jgi:hypothetical protein
MSISDPARILQRVPELRELIDDAKIRHAIESGDPFRIYRALMLARLLRRLPQQRALLKTLTGERRLFARPLKSTPGLGTINSVGLSFVGQSERDDEGYHVALHAFVVLFALPIIPLGAYLVKSTGERQWQIYARVPLGMAGWLYTRGLALLLVLSVLLGAGQSWHESGEHDLLLVNGFGEAATVNFGGQRTSIPANGMATVRLKVGPVSGNASVGVAGVVDQFSQNLRFGSQTSIWNIAGAAPLLLEQVVYYRSGSDKPNTPPAHTNYCGQRFVELGKVDYAFTEPPREISMSKHDTQRTVSHLLLYRDARDAKRSGAEICAGSLLGSSEIKNIAPALEALAALQKWDLRQTGFAVFAARAVSPATAARVAQRAMQAKPELEYMRLYRAVAEDADQHDQLVPQFAALLASQPDNPDYHYLNASLWSGLDSIAALQKVQQRFPGHARSLASLVWHKAAHGDYAGADQDWQRLRQLAPAVADVQLDVEVQVLLALHQGRAALQLLQNNLKDKDGEDHARHAVDYLLLARQLGQNDPEQWVRHYQAEPEGRNTLALALHGQRAGWVQGRELEAGLQGVLQLSMDLRNQPAQALQNAKAIAPILVQELPSDQLALLLSEALRTGNAPVAQLAREHSSLPQAGFALLRQYVQGQAVALDAADFNLEQQAAAHFCRSRQPNLAAGERERLRSLAQQLDVLHGAISVALERWPNHE